MSDDIPLEPTPIEVESYVALVTNPLVGSVLLGLPFGAVATAATVLGVDLTPSTGVIIDFLAGWASGATVMLLMLSRPY
jgi:hypothetical protein